MMLERKIDYNEMQRLGFSKMLDVRLVNKAILSEDKDALRELIFETVEKLNKSDIRMDDFYYGSTIPMSNEPFDMFDLKTIREIFGAFGYDLKEEYFEEGIDGWEETEDGYLAGKLNIYKDGFRFSTNIIHTMHNSLISMFIDTKNFEVLEVGEISPFEIISHAISFGVYDKEVLLEIEIEPCTYTEEDIEKQILELHFEEESREYLCCMIYDVLDDEDGASEGRYLKLNNKEMLFIKKYIDENMLDFVM